MENQKWQAYGDVNPLDHGGQWIKQLTPTTFRVVILITPSENVDNDMYCIEDCEVDITDSWIDWESVKMSCDTPPNDPIRQAMDAISHYGTANFGSDFSSYLLTEEDTIEELGLFEIKL